MAFGLGIFAAIIVIVLIVFFVNRGNTKANKIKLREVGTIIDRALWDYRANLVPLLIISAICLVFGNISQYGSFFLGLTWGLVDPAWLISGGQGVWFTIHSVLNTLGYFGIGKTLLVCAVASMAYNRKPGEPMRLADALPRGRWGAVAGMAALMIVPTLLLSFLGIIGGAVWLLWAIAPVVMFYEGLNPWKAMGRSSSIVRKQWSALLNTLVPLWVIGWLLIGVPTYGSVLLAHNVLALGDGLSSQIALVSWLLGSVFVAPLVAMGMLHYYTYVREHVAATTELTYDELVEAVQGQTAPTGKLS